MEGHGEDVVAVICFGRVWVVGSVLWEWVGSEEVSGGKRVLWL